MKIIYNKIIPFRGFLAINLFGVLFVRENFRETITPVTLSHESIHTAQMRELLWIGFYLLYILEWIVRLFMRGSAYRNISFEREAYANQHSPEYLRERKRYAWIKYLKKTEI